MSDLNLKDACGFIVAELKRDGFNMVDVGVTDSALIEIEINANEISLLRSNNTRSATIRVIESGRHATCNLNQFDKASLQTASAALTEAVKLASADEAWAFAPKPAESMLSAGIATHDREQMYDALAEFLYTSRTQWPDLNFDMCAIQFRHNDSYSWASTGLDLAVSQGFYLSSAFYSAKRGDKTSSFNYSSSCFIDFERPLLETGAYQRTMASAVRELEHKPLKGKLRAPVVFAPEAFDDLLSCWADHLHDGMMLTGTSGLQDKLGESVASPLLTVRHSIGDPRFAITELCTGDGYLSEPSTLIERGVLQSFCLSDYGARRLGKQRAKNSGTNLQVAPGRDSFESLLKSVENGLFVQRLSLGSAAANGDFSGVAKNSYLIDGGVVAQPLSEVMISGNLFALMNDITALSSELMNDGVQEIPYVVAEGMTVVGT